MLGCGQRAALCRKGRRGLSAKVARLNRAPTLLPLPTGLRKVPFQICATEGAWRGD